MLCQSSNTYKNKNNPGYPICKGSETPGEEHRLRGQAG